MDFFERVTTGVEGLIELTEDRRYAWLLAAAGLLVTAVCWYVALGAPDLMQSLYGPSAADDDGPRRGPLRLVAILTALVTIGGPFIAIQAAASAFAPDGSRSEAGSDPVFNYMARNQADRQRRVRLGAAIVGVTNLFLLWIFSQ